MTVSLNEEEYNKPWSLLGSRGMITSMPTQWYVVCRYIPISTFHLKVGFHSRNRRKFWRGPPYWFVDFPPHMVYIDLRLDFPPQYKAKGSGKPELSVPSTAPPSLEKGLSEASGRERIPPPKRAWDFLPDLMEKTNEDGFELRKDVKPLHIVQPEGVSFKIDGNVLEWQNWKMHVGELFLRLSGCVKH